MKLLAYINKMTVKNTASVRNMVSSFLLMAVTSSNSKWFHNKFLVCYIFEASYILLSLYHAKKKKKIVKTIFLYLCMA